MTYRAHSWEQVIASLGDLARHDAAFAPLRDAAEQLARSRYAAGLYPVLSLATLRLLQHEDWGPRDEELRLDLEGGEFVVRHLASLTPDPRFALPPHQVMWTKRGPEALALLERAFHHLRWFVEYRASGADHEGSSDVDTPRTPA